MYDYIQGVLRDIRESIAVVDVGGIGYQIMISQSTLFALPQPGKTVKLYTHLKMQNEAFVLYGFISNAERELYLALNTVTGVGPKAAISLLSVFTPEQIIGAIMEKDAKFLSRAPGVGKKTAERIILELKDKFGDIGEFMVADRSAQEEYAEEKELCIQALITLGYSAQMSGRMVERTFDSAETTQNNILKALAQADSI
jgi:Holliday junction DNA helicase RuvA